MFPGADLTDSPPSGLESWWEETSTAATDLTDSQDPLDLHSFSNQIFCLIEIFLPGPQGRERLQKRSGEFSERLDRPDHILDGLRPVSEVLTEDSHDPPSLLPPRPGHTTLTLSLSPAPHHHSHNRPGQFLQCKHRERRSGHSTSGWLKLFCLEGESLGDHSANWTSINKQIFPSAIYVFYFDLEFDPELKVNFDLLAQIHHFQANRDDSICQFVL